MRATKRLLRPRSASQKDMDPKEERYFDGLARAATCRLCNDIMDEDLSSLPCGHCFCARAAGVEGTALSVTARTDER